MTRKELAQRRKRRRREQKIRKVVKTAIAVLAALAVFCFIWFVIRPMFFDKKTVTTAEASQLPESTATASDTATTSKPDDTTSGTNGWNVDDTGWWFKNEDGTRIVNGWKTIDGKQYYFGENGYTLKGWNYIEADGKDAYFDESGAYDPTKKQKLVAITFDDGPSEDTDTILDILEANHSKATFFVVGTMVQLEDETKNALKREYDLGMEIGSHTYDHTILSKTTPDVIQTVMQQNDDLISSMLDGFVPTIMRPTGGGVNDTVSENVTKPMILWNIDTEDWNTQDPGQTIAAATTDIKDGSIILMHDIYIQTAEAVKTIVPTLRQQGYKLVTVSELAEAYGYSLEAGQCYYDFYPQDSGTSSDAADSFSEIDDSVPAA